MTKERLLPAVHIKSYDALIIAFALLLVFISACQPPPPVTQQGVASTPVEKKETHTPVEIVFVQAVEQENGTWRMHRIVSLH